MRGPWLGRSRTHNICNRGDWKISSNARRLRQSAKNKEFAMCAFAQSGASGADRWQMKGKGYRRTRCALCPNFRCPVLPGRAPTTLYGLQARTCAASLRKPSVIGSEAVAPPDHLAGSREQCARAAVVHILQWALKNRTKSQRWGSSLRSRLVTAHFEASAVLLYAKSAAWCQVVELPAGSPRATLCPAATRYQ